MKYLKSYNESFNNESTLREALEIYVEDLPFSVSIMDIEVKYVSSYKSYVITYEHTEDGLNLFSKIVNLDPEEDDSEHKRIKQTALVKELLLDKVDVVFGRFAKKYDMVYVPSKVAYIPAEGDSVDVRFELKQLARQRIKPHNESLESNQIVEAIKIELEDCVDFEIESIEPYKYRASTESPNHSIRNVQLAIREDFGGNDKVRKMIDGYMESTERFSAEKVDFAASLKHDIYDVAKQINTTIFSKIARKYDIKDLDIYVSGHNWRLNESYSITAFISGKI